MIEFAKFSLTDLISVIANAITCIAIICTAIYAYNNIKALNKSNEQAKIQIEQNAEYADKNIKALEETNAQTRFQIEQDATKAFLTQICLGLLHNGNYNDMSHYEKYMFNRMKINGFYDGVRAYLGDQMNLPYYPLDSLLEAREKGQAIHFFERGPYRYKKTWDYLFRLFHKICEADRVDSGLNDYIDGNKNHKYHHLDLKFDFMTGINGLISDREKRHSPDTIDSACQTSATFPSLNATAMSMTASTLAATDFLECIGWQKDKSQEFVVCPTCKSRLNKRHIQKNCPCCNYNIVE